jgi:sarcosine oxidase, subunit gamma
MTAPLPATSIPGVFPCTPGTRFGVKGAGAADWLAARGIAVPAAANRVGHWPGAGGGRCLRLGTTEFLVEYDAPDSSVPVAAPGDAAWILLRSDCSLLLDGPPWPAALSQACSFDFDRLHQEPDLVVMTLLAGISVVLAREPRAPAPPLALRLWCDASYGNYLQNCLQQLAAPGDPR